MLVPRAGLEPAPLSRPDFESGVATNYTTEANDRNLAVYVADFSAPQTVFLCISLQAKNKRLTKKISSQSTACVVHRFGALSFESRASTDFATEAGAVERGILPHGDRRGLHGTSVMPLKSADRTRRLDC